MPYRSSFHSVFWIETGIASFVFLAVVGVMAFALYRYRARRKKALPPSHRSEWTVVEGSYVLVVFCAAVFLVWLSLSQNGREVAADAEKPALVVKVTGFQWCWRFDYVGHHSTVQGTCRGGYTLPTLVVPTGETVKFEVTSDDVVHEFWLPYLDYKIQAFPDHVNTFVATFPSTGRWEGHCAEFCGLFHPYMLFWVHAEPKAAFTTWLSHHHGLIVQ